MPKLPLSKDLMLGIGISKTYWKFRISENPAAKVQIASDMCHFHQNHKMESIDILYKIQYYPVYIYVYIYTYVYIYICIYIYMYVYIYTHTHHISLSKSLSHLERKKKLHA